MLPRLFRRPVPAAVTVVDLTAYNSERSGALTPIKEPESLSPLPQPTPSGLPSRADLELDLNQWVEETTNPLMYDEACGDFFAPWLDQKVAGWEAAVRQHAQASRKTAQRLYGAHRQDLAYELETNAVLNRQVARLQAAEVRYTAMVAPATHRTPPDAATTAEGPSGFASKARAFLTIPLPDPTTTGCTAKERS